MVNYIFNELDPDPSEECDYANYNEIGDAITIHLKSFKDNLKVIEFNLENIAAEWFIGLIIHEHIHQTLVNLDLKTTSEQDHYAIEHFL